MDNSLNILEEEYYSFLDEYFHVCQELLETGKDYMAIILCHELFRFLYPLEPFADFKHTAPVPHSVDLLKRLIAAGKAANQGIFGYGKEDAQEYMVDVPVEEDTSLLYTDLWKGYDEAVMSVESRELLIKRLSEDFVDGLKGKTVLDLGCGSGRYSIALAYAGAKSVSAVDYNSRSYAWSETYAKENGLNISFSEANILALPFEDEAFDFVFCNGVLHHSTDWRQGFREFSRVMKEGGFIYLYATGGFFWNTRDRLREFFLQIPRQRTDAVLKMIGMPPNRMVFIDTWHVPIEDHISKAEIEAIASQNGLRFEKVVSKHELDMDNALTAGFEGAEIVWGEGEHRYQFYK